MPAPLTYGAKSRVKPASWHCKDTTDPTALQQELLSLRALNIPLYTNDPGHYLPSVSYLLLSTPHIYLDVKKSPPYLEPSIFPP